MKRLSARNALLTLASVAFGVLGLASAAQARTDVYFSVGVPVAPAPVYVEPAPVYVQPAPVYSVPQPVYAQPPVYVPPAPVYAQPDYAWEREREWRREEWRRRQWQRHYWRHHHEWDD